MHYHFSLAREEDASAVFALYRSLIGIPGCTWSDDYPTKDFVRNDIRMQSLYILKDTQGNLIAAASAGGERELDDLHWDMQNPCELARVGVSLSLQNQGIGTYLLKRVVAAVKERGFDGICMLVSKANPHALALYEKNGFTRCGELRRYGLDFYRYQMDFNKAETTDNRPFV